MTIFRIIGRVIDFKARQGIAELRVEAWDKDLIFDDLLGNAVTDNDGAFTITFDETYFQEVFFDRKPDVFFKVYYGTNLIKSTEDSVLWNVNAGELPIIIEVDMETHEATKSTPDLIPLKSLQAKRLAQLSGLKSEDLVNKHIAELSDQFKWIIDPKFFFFQRICGKVVKKDPVTEEQYPVPFATVYVEDTDCNLLSFFPSGSPWVWHFPLWCHREIIATTKTDKCGNFCVWVPRFDIDWILRWRKARICFPLIFRRPRLDDIIPRLPEEVVGPWPPIPVPDPGPLRTLAKLPPLTIEAIAGTSVGKRVARAARLQTFQKLGAPNPMAESLLQTRAFERELPPPLPAEFHSARSGQDSLADEGASSLEGIRSAIALKLGVDVSAEVLADFDPHRFIGPFLRCHDIFLPQWQLIFDVPDIAFRVGQDVNGDGVEETIYSESFFEVRWDTDPLPDVTLVASDIAKETRACQTPVVPCGNVPAILFAGFMPLTLPAYFDSASGYALRPNRPSLTGSTPAASPGGRPDAETPFCWTVQLYGCVALNNAIYYRVLQSIDGGTTFSAVTGLSWNNYRETGGAPIPITADAKGWYEVNPHDMSSPPVQVARDDLAFPNLLLDWPTPPLGKVILKLETGDAAKNHIAYSSTVAIQVDNTAPTVSVTQLAWKFVGEPDSALRNLFGIPCPRIRRGTVPKDVELVFEVNVSAQHLRNASIHTRGCGSGNFVPEADPLNDSSHWHTSGSDNTELLHQRYTLDHTAMEGSYWFYCHAHTRAMNPSGADGGNQLPTPDWNYDPGGYIWVEPWYGIAVIDGD
jgi:hypothetical protein